MQFNLGLQEASDLFIHLFCLHKPEDEEGGVKGEAALWNSDTQQPEHINRGEIRISDHCCFHEDVSLLESTNLPGNICLSIWAKNTISLSLLPAIIIPVYPTKREESPSDLTVESNSWKITNLSKTQWPSQKVFL